MAFLGGLLSSALPFLGRAASGAISGVSQALTKGGGFGDVLKSGALGALSGLVGQPDETPRVEPRPVPLESAPTYEPREPRPVRHRGPVGAVGSRIPQMFHKKKSKTKKRR